MKLEISENTNKIKWDVLPFVAGQELVPSALSVIWKKNDYVV